MLKQLLIKNYALINELEISPSANLNIITGETGAGKSILLGAVGLLLGNRADTKVLLDDSNKCIIEGHFDISDYKLESTFRKEDLDYEKTTIIRREITPAGKSRAFVNDSPVTLDSLKKLGIKLMDIHSQHETLQLGKNTFQLKFVDVYANTLHLRNEYYGLYNTYKSALSKLETLKINKKEAAKEADYNGFLLEELVEAKLQIGEQEELEEAVKVMENSEEIKLRLNECFELFNSEEISITSGLQQVRVALSQISKYSEQYKQLADRLESVLIEVNDLSSEIEKEETDIQFDPAEAEQAQQRISLIYQLQQKHNVDSIEELLSIQATLEEKVNFALNLDDDIAKLEKEVKLLHQNCNDKASILSGKRIKCFNDLQSELISLLQDVGVGDATIEIEQNEIELDPSGKDQISILFSANKGVPAQPLSKVASGGEFSRLMFCLKYILASKVSLPTVIFDEIDTGVSGEIAKKLGTMMKKMAQNHQVITISHLPQIASKGDQHYHVYKDSSSEMTMSRIKSLSEDQRIEEIAKMLSGENPSEIAFQNAKELMKSE